MSSHPPYTSAQKSNVNDNNMTTCIGAPCDNVTLLQSRGAERAPIARNDVVIIKLVKEIELFGM